MLLQVEMPKGNLTFPEKLLEQEIQRLSCALNSVSLDGSDIGALAGSIDGVISNYRGVYNAILSAAVIQQQNPYKPLQDLQRLVYENLSKMLPNPDVFIKKEDGKTGSLDDDMNEVLLDLFKTRLDFYLRLLKHGFCTNMSYEEAVQKEFNRDGYRMALTNITDTETKFYIDLKEKNKGSRFYDRLIEAIKKARNEEIDRVFSQWTNSTL